MSLQAPERHPACPSVSKLPRLARLFAWAYGGQGTLRNSTGEVVGINAIGTRQGDPLGSLFFSIGAHSTVKKIFEIVKRHSHDVTSFVPPLAYIDDFSIFCRVDDVAPICGEVCELMATDGLLLSHPKCAIVGSALTPHRAQQVKEALCCSDYHADQFKVSDRGITLGIPIGNKDYVMEQVTDMLEAMLLPVPFLSEFDPSFGFCVLRHCIAARPTYLAKIIEPWSDFVPLLRRFDDYLLSGIVNHHAFQGIQPPNLRCATACAFSERFWAMSGYPVRPPMMPLGDASSIISVPFFSTPMRATNAPLNDDLDSIMDRLVSTWEAEQFIERILAELPPERGGLGLRRVSGIGGHKACVIARLRTLDFMYYRGMRESYTAILEQRKRLGLFKIPISHAAIMEEPASIPDVDSVDRAAPSFFEVPDPTDPDNLLNHGHASDNFHQVINSRAKEGMQQMVGLVSELLEGLLVHEHSHYRNWWKHTSQYPGRGHWLHYSNLMAAHRQMSGEEWCRLLDLQLLRAPRQMRELILLHHPPALPAPDPSYRFPGHAHCPEDSPLLQNVAFLQLRSMACHLCGDQVNFIMSPYHCLGCRGFQKGVFHARHDAVRNALQIGLTQVTNNLRDNAIIVDPEPVFYLLPRETTADPTITIFSDEPSSPENPPTTTADAALSTTTNGSSSNNAVVSSQQQPTAGNVPPLLPAITNTAETNPAVQEEEVSMPRHDRKRADMFIRRTYPSSTDPSTGTSYPEWHKAVVIDVAVCSPVATSYLPDVSPHSQRAADMVEYIKFNKYRHTIREMPEQALFRPMVFNAAGTPGYAFYSVLADHLDLHSRAIYSIAGKIGTIIARYNGRMIDTFVKGFATQFATRAIHSPHPTPHFHIPTIIALDGPVLN